MTTNKIKEKLKLVPEKPGCYIHKDINGNVIYVGKAKNLKRRVSSYFNKIHTGKTKALVDTIDDFTYIVTKTDAESFILEINLIKKYSPKYNILLKDDKTYPYIMLTNEKYPILKIIRSKKRKKTKNKLFGPYPNVTSAKDTVAILNRIYPLRKCERMPKDTCLYYHINECLGYCKYKVDEEKIKEMLKEITSILNGDHKILTKKLQEEMLKASESLNYEKANMIKHEIEDIKETVEKQVIVSNVEYNFDCFAYIIKDDFISCETLFVRKGVVVGTVNEIFSLKEQEDDFITRYIIDFYTKYEVPRQIIVKDETDIDTLSEILNTNIKQVSKGKLNDIYKMTLENAKISLDNEIEKLRKDENTKKAVTEDLKRLLNLKNLERIELFDNSHLFGTFYVGGMVVYNNMEPQKDEYRKFKIDKNVTNDIDAMKEVIYRRYYRVLVQDLKKPDLIIVDGGETQVKAVLEVLNSLNLDIKVAGLKKDDNHRTKVLINEFLEEIPLPKDNKLFLYLTKMQDEVHRFAITYHRDIKAKGSISSILDNIKGIGSVRRKALLKKYKNINKIKEAPLEELSKIIPKDVAQNLLEFLNGK